MIISHGAFDIWSCPVSLFFLLCACVCVCVRLSSLLPPPPPPPSSFFFLIFLKNKTPLKKDAVPPGQTHDEWWGASLHVSTRCVVRSLLLAAGCTALSIYDLDSFRLIAIFIFVFSDISIEHFPPVLTCNFVSREIRFSLLKLNSLKHKKKQQNSNDCGQSDV